MVVWMTVRETSIEAYHKIAPLLPQKRRDVYLALAEFGPCTANELFRKWKLRNSVVQANFHARLGELRDQGCVEELSERQCEVTGETVTVWAVTLNTPVKLDKPKRIKCKHCNGKGYIQTQQTRFDI